MRHICIKQKNQKRSRNEMEWNGLNEPSNHAKCAPRCWIYSWGRCNTPHHTAPYLSIQNFINITNRCTTACMLPTFLSFWIIDLKHFFSSLFYLAIFRAIVCYELWCESYRCCRCCFCYCHCCGRSRSTNSTTASSIYNGNSIIKWNAVTGRLAMASEGCDRFLFDLSK